MKVSRWALGALLLLFVACSAERAVENTLDKIPVPDFGGGVGDGLGEGSESLKPTSPPDTVPRPFVGSDYFGMHELIVDDSMSFFLEDGGDIQVIDLEYRPTADKTLTLGNLSSLTIGDCPDFSRSALWLRVSEQGEVLSEEAIDFFWNGLAEAGQRYLARVTYENVTGCSSLSLSVQILESIDR